MHEYQFSSPCVLPFTSLTSEKVILRRVPEAICCCLQTCIVVMIILAIEYITCTKFRSHVSLEHQSVSRRSM